MSEVMRERVMGLADDDPIRAGILKAEDGGETKITLRNLNLQVGKQHARKQRSA